MKNILSGWVLLLVTLLAIPTSSQTDQEYAPADSVITKPAQFKHFGYSFGVDYSLLRLKSTPFYTESETPGNVSTVNSPGFIAGMFYHFVHSGIRVGIDLNVTPSALRYDTGKRNKEEHWIYPFTIEIPIHYIADFRPESGKGSGYSAGVRFIFPNTPFHDRFPVQTSAGINLDIAWSWKFDWQLAACRMEVFYSYGLLNLIDQNTDDWRNHSVKRLTRDLAGVRLYFN